MSNYCRYSVIHTRGKSVATNMIAAYYSKGCDSIAMSDRGEVSKALSMSQMTLEKI